MDLVLAAIHLEVSPRAVPLGPAMLASALKRAFGSGLSVRVMDLYLQEDPAACARRILAENPRWVGLSMYLWNRDFALRLATALKAGAPDIVVFAGGAEATADLSGVLAHPAMDFVLPGEGEELVVAALERLTRGETPGAVQAAVRPGPVADLSTLTSPWLDGTLDPGAYPGQLWELSRGCPFKCDFCFESRGDAGIRRIPMERIEAELELFEARGVSQVFVLDPTFNFDRARAKDVLRLIAGAAPAIHFFFEIRSEFIDRELARLFASVRCTLQIGLQSAHDAVLRNIGRRIDRADFEAKILLLHRAGATYGFDLIYGLPGDDLDGFKASLDFALSLAPNHLDIFPLAVLPGTRLHDTAPSFGLEHQPENPYLVTGSPTFGPEAMREAGRIARACDVFYNEGKAVPWFAIVQGALELEPSELFRRFADHQEARPGQAPADLQTSFVLALFEEREAPAMGSVAVDLITYFGIAAQLTEGAATRVPAPPPPGLSLHPDARLATFRHDPAAILEQLACGITELEDLSYVVPEEPCKAVLHLRDGETRIHAVTPGQARILAMLPGERPEEEDLLAPLFEAGIMTLGTKPTI